MYFLLWIVHHQLWMIELMLEHWTNVHPTTTTTTYINITHVWCSRIAINVIHGCCISHRILDLQVLLLYIIGKVLKIDNVTCLINNIYEMQSA